MRRTSIQLLYDGGEDRLAYLRHRKEVVMSTGLYFIRLHNFSLCAIFVLRYGTFFFERNNIFQRSPPYPLPGKCTRAP